MIMMMVMLYETNKCPTFVSLIRCLEDGDDDNDNDGVEV